VPDRKAFTGILFVLRSGIPWEMLPQEMGCGSGMTCWRRLYEWHDVGVFEQFHAVLLDRLGYADEIDWSRACLDASHVPAKGGGSGVGPSPVDRGKPGTKRHLATDRKGIPLAFLLTPANMHDSVVFEELIDSIGPIKRPRGRPRKRPEKLHADKAYDNRRCRSALTRRRIKVRIARKGVESSERLGRHRWVVERTLAWYPQMHRRLRIRYERRDEIWEAWHHLASALICLRQLT
jgi:transposase